MHIATIRPQTEIDLEAVHQEFLSHPKDYQSAYVLSVKLKMNPFKVRRLIRILRIRGVGILSGRGGYILSKHANQRDDLKFMRQCYGRRVSDYLTLSAAKPDMEKRWKAVENKRAMQVLLGPINIDIEESRGMKILTEYSEKLEI